jgi:hypothetical protein
VIIGSILFVLVAAGLLAVGVALGENAFYYLSIVASAIAALSLLVGVRQATNRRGDDDFDIRPISTRRPVPAIGNLAVPRQITGGPSAVPTAAIASTPHDPASGTGVLPDPPDEPSVQAITDLVATRVAGLMTDVAVIDGRPRYHLIECVHLLGRDHERLPVKEAVMLGFTPCGTCEPVTVLLAAARP